MFDGLDSRAPDLEDAALARVVFLLEQGDLSKAYRALQNLEGTHDQERLVHTRAVVLERLQAPFANFSPIAFPKQNIPDGFARCILYMMQHRAEKDKPLIIGIGGPSGAGKSTLINSLQECFTSYGLSLGEIGVWDQDVHFVDNLASCDFSGHHPDARKWEELTAALEELRQSKQFSVIFCQSNGAFLREDLSGLYDLRIGIHANLETLCQRRLITRPDGREHFLRKTQPDIVSYTYPSLAKNADLLVTTSYPPGRVYLNKESFAGNEYLRDMLVYILNSDPFGWDRIWTKDQERFTGNPTWVCQESIRQCGQRATKTVLEIGPGASGRDARCFLGAGFMFAGVDISRTACCSLINRAQEDGIDLSLRDINDPEPWENCVICGDTLAALKLAKRRGLKFDIVHFYSTLHYAPPAILDDIMQCTRSICNGCVSIAVKTDADRTFQMGQETIYPNGRVYENANKADLRFAYTGQSMQELLERNGFRIVRQNEQGELFDAAQVGDEQQSPFINTIAVVA